MNNGLLELFPNASADFLARNSELPVSKDRPRSKAGDTAAGGAKLERHAATAAVGKKKAEAGNSSRYVIRVTSCRRRLIDEDNLCEKYVVDCCRYAGCLPGDEPGKTKIEVAQRKAGKEEQEHTLVEIFEV